MSAVCDVSTVGLHTLSAVATPGSLSILAGLYTLVSSHQPGLVRSHMIHTGPSSLMFLHNRMIMRFTMQHSHSHTISESQLCCSHLLKSEIAIIKRMTKIISSSTEIQHLTTAHVNTNQESKLCWENFGIFFRKLPALGISVSHHTTHTRAGIHCRLELTLEQSNEKSDKMQTEYTITHHTIPSSSLSW